jgi:hypothetical protein
MNAVPLLLKTPTLKTPIKAPTIVSQPGLQPTLRKSDEYDYMPESPESARLDAIRLTKLSGRWNALHFPTEFRICPIKDDEELQQAWKAGSLSVPAGGHEAFFSGRRNGILGRPEIQPDDPDMLKLWEEGQEEGFRIAEGMSRDELSFGRGFRSGMDLKPTIRGPVPSEWDRGYSVASLSGLEEEKLGPPEPCSHLHEVAAPKPVLRALFQNPFRKGTASCRLFKVLNLSKKPLSLEDIRWKAHITKRKAKLLLGAYVGHVHNVPLLRIGAALAKEGDSFLLVPCKKEPNARRVRAVRVPIGKPSKKRRIS